MLNFTTLLESIIAFIERVSKHISVNSGENGYISTYLNNTLKVFLQFTLKYKNALIAIRNMTINGLLERAQKGDHSPFFYLFIFGFCFTLSLVNCFFPGTSKRSKLIFPVAFSFLFCVIHGNFLVSLEHFIVDTMKSSKDDNTKGYIDTLLSFNIPSIIVTLLCYRVIASMYTILKLGSILYVILMTKNYILIPEYAGRWDILILFCVMSLLIFIFAYAVYNAIEYLISTVVLSISSSFVIVTSLRVVADILDPKIDSFVSDLSSGRYFDLKNHIFVLFAVISLFGIYRHLSFMTNYLERKMK